eukprot:4948152-Amphidinium_carterae.1
MLARDEASILLERCLHRSVPSCGAYRCNGSLGCVEYSRVYCISPVFAIPKFPKVEFERNYLLQFFPELSKHLRLCVPVVAWHTPCQSMSHCKSRAQSVRIAAAMAWRELSPERK